MVKLNPQNGFSIAAMKDIDFKIKLPNAFTTYEENFAKFVTLWMNIDSDVKLLYDNIESHLAKNEYRCIDCYFPFATVCA